MEITVKTIGELKPYKNNPRKNEAAIDKVAASISRFGFKVPMVIDSNNEIVCGHTRFEAAKKLGLKEVPCILADDLSEEEIKAFRLADNKTAELAGWDFELLDIELEEITDINMEEFGFTDDEDIEDIDDFFSEAPEKDKGPRRIQCPHCGEFIDL